jgi:hypothetical protein
MDPSSPFHPKQQPLPKVFRKGDGALELINETPKESLTKVLTLYIIGNASEAPGWPLETNLIRFKFYI